MTPDLARELRAGSIRALARAISMVERRDPAGRPLLESLGESLKRPPVLGLTGAPGTGKSALADRLIDVLRSREESVGVVAVDPNSPYSGGALLGDRIRMQKHALDPQVFIRSMGARGHLGGLSLATREVVRLLGAFGFTQVIVETVGVGQSELDVAAVADTTLVVLAPGMGDGVQMIKAGIMEIADVFAVNKADLPGAERTVMEIRGMLNSGPKLEWKPPIVPTSATTGRGLEELWSAVERHRAHLFESGRAGAREAARLTEETVDLVGEWARQEARRLLEEDPSLSSELVAAGVPYPVAERIRARSRKGARS
ncbi:MAG: methylmalonyl Co-A mutase-associated GTPase MeaB [Candidatus Dormibacterales bacterium]